MARKSPTRRRPPKPPEARPLTVATKPDRGICTSARGAARAAMASANEVTYFVGEIGRLLDRVADSEGKALPWGSVNAARFWADFIQNTWTESYADCMYSDFAGWFAPALAEEATTAEEGA